MVDPTQYFVTAPRHRAVDDARTAILDPESKGARDERAWERMHPDGQATFVGESRLVLWNFAVGEATLKPGHDAAIAEFLRRHRLRLIYGGAMLAIEGHASATGAEAMNQRLSQQRAEVVALKLMMNGVPSSSVGAIAAGERQPTGRGDTGEALARDRRVNVVLFLPAPPQPAPVPDGKPEPQAYEPPPPPGQAPLDFTANVRFTVKIGPGEFPSRLGTLMLEGEIYLIRIGPPGATMTYRLDIAEGQLKQALEIWVNRNVRVSVGERGAFGVRVFQDLLVDFEVKPSDPRWPFTVGFNMPPVPEVFEVAGIRFRIAGGKLRVGFRPSPELVRWLTQLGQRFLSSIASWVTGVGAAEAVTVGAGALLPVAYVGFVVWGLYELNEAHRRGTRRGLAANLRRGYARTIAYAALGRHASAEDIEAGPGFGDERMARRAGAMIAEEGWNKLDEVEKSVISDALTGLGPAAATESVLAAIGGAWGNQQIPHPRELINGLPRRR